MRKFKLLKDTHKARAGFIVYYDFGNECYFGEEFDKDYFSKEEVENNPEWFEEITDPWIWTDELAKEYVMFGIQQMIENGIDHINGDYFLDKFRASRQKQIQK